MSDEKHIYKEPGMYAEIVQIDEESLLPGMEDTPENVEKYKFIREVETIIEAIRTGKMEGEYFEF